MPDSTVETVTLALVLTGAGTTIAAALIASVIEILKRVQPIGGWLDAGREATVAALLALLLVAYAFVATTSHPDLVNAFAAFLAWVGIAGLATKAYDVARATKAAVTG